jgi:hypothetical protein
MTTPVKGKYLSADDFGPLGRLVPPGELWVIEPRDAPRLVAEREWIGEQYQHADRLAERYRKRLGTAAASGRRDVIREWFEVWTWEAAKLALCDRYLLAVIGQLDLGKRQAMNPPKTFKFRDLPQIKEVTARFMRASDEEIVGGTVYRAK